jgi:uncharacterized membrane protein
MLWVFLVNVVSGLMLAGLIWFVQVVHYPLFKRADRERYEKFAADHTRLTGYVVAPLMLAEVFTAVLLPYFPPAFVTVNEAWLGLIMVGAVWVSTFTIQVPLHKRLSKGYNSNAVRALVLTNWIRTIIWSGRTVLIVWWLARGLRDGY